MVQLMDETSHHPRHAYPTSTSTRLVASPPSTPKTGPSTTATTHSETRLKPSDRRHSRAKNPSAPVYTPAQPSLTSAPFATNTINSAALPSAKKPASPESRRHGTTNGMPRIGSSLRQLPTEVDGSARTTPWGAAPQKNNWTPTAMRWKRSCSPGMETLCEQTTTAKNLPRQVVLTWDYDGFRPLTQTERVYSAAAPQDVIDERFFASVTDIVGTPTELVDESGAFSWRTRSTLWGITAWSTDSTAYTPLRLPGSTSTLKPACTTTTSASTIPKPPGTSPPTPWGSRQHPTRQPTYLIRAPPLTLSPVSPRQPLRPAGLPPSPRRIGHYRSMDAAPNPADARSGRRHSRQRPAPCLGLQGSCHLSRPAGPVVIPGAGVDRAHRVLP